MNENELKLLEDLQDVIYASKKVNDAEVCFVLAELLRQHSPLEEDKK